MQVYIEDSGKHEGEEVTIKGWLHNRRSSGKIHFLILRDGTGFIQGVMSKAAVGEELFKTADHLSQETSLTVTGTARAATRAPSGYAIHGQSLAAGAHREIEGAASPHRVLDGRAGDGVRRPERRDESRGGSGRVGRRARARQAPARAGDHRARRHEARSGSEAVSAHLVRRCGEEA